MNTSRENYCKNVCACPGLKKGCSKEKCAIWMAPTADVVEVVPELRKTVELLCKEYEKAKKLDFVYDPTAYAVYQVWKAVDGRRKNGR